MKLKKTRKNRTCSVCSAPIPKGALYGSKTISIPMKSTIWTIDNRPKEEIPDWAWETTYFKKVSSICEGCNDE